MTLVTSTRYRDAEGNVQETSEEHELVAFGPLAGVCARVCRKGNLVYAEGRIRTRHRTDAAPTPRPVTEIVLDVMRVLDRRAAAAAEAKEPLVGVSRHADPNRTTEVAEDPAAMMPAASLSGV